MSNRTVPYKDYHDAAMRILALEDELLRVSRQSDNVSTCDFLGCSIAAELRCCSPFPQDIEDLTEKLKVSEQLRVKAENDRNSLSGRLTRLAELEAKVVTLERENKR